MKYPILLFFLSFCLLAHAQDQPTRDSTRRNPLISLPSISDCEKPLLIVKGVAMPCSMDLGEIPLDKIKSKLKLEKGDPAVIAIYGASGINGVLILDLHGEDRHTKFHLRRTSPSFTARHAPSFAWWADNYLVEIWEKKGRRVGTLTYWVREEVPEGESPTHRIYAKTTTLGKGKVESILQLIDSTGILSIPPQDSISDWAVAFDGELYVIEANGERKAYDSPHSQKKSVEEVRLLLHFYRRMTQIAVVPARWRDFTEVIPFECYSGSGSMVICNEPHRKYKRERHRYRKRRMKK